MKSILLGANEHTTLTGYRLDVYFLMPSAIDIKNQMEPNYHGQLRTALHILTRSKDFLYNKHWTQI